MTDRHAEELKRMRLAVAESQRESAIADIAIDTVLLRAVDSRQHPMLENGSANHVTN
jgi:hypothetical protein